MGKKAHQAKTHRTQQQTQEHARQARLRCLANEHPVQKTEEPKDSAWHGNQEQENPMDLSKILKPSSFTDYCLTVFTGLLAAVAIWQSVVTSGQLGVMRTDQRAWVQFQVQHKPDEDVISLQLTSGQPIVLPFQIINTGKTPAKYIDGRIYYDFPETGSEPPLNLVNSNDLEHAFNKVEAGMINPAEALKMYGERPERPGVAKVATDDEVIRARERKIHLAVFGIMNYDDVFGVHHWIKFCKWISVDPYYSTEGCTKFNSIDDN
jgi:hypothetical protein